MSDVSDDRNPQYFVHSLRQYVLAPLSTAQRLADREHREVAAEADAFEAFRQRIEDIDPRPSTPPDTPSPLAASTSQSADDGIERVREAFRGTVLSTPHYEETYGESLHDHLASEFGAELADAFRSASSVSFTAPYKATLLARAELAVRTRRNFLGTLDDERQSLAAARDDLASLFAALDTTIIPEWHCESFTVQLDDVAQRRQRTIQGRDAVAHFDAHSLCALLYADESWSYPVLTAVARTREAVSLDGSPTTRTTNSARG